MISRINIKHILTAGFILRLLAVFFSKGYAFYDDHFAVMELANEWTKGNISEITGGGVYVFSLLYPGLHYLLILFCHTIGITDPEGIMILVRLFHAGVSVTAIYYAWRLVSCITDNKELPLLVAALMAIMWMFPFLSVRNLREFFCIPFLLAGSYYSIKKDESIKSVILSSFFFVLAVDIRIQCVIFPFVTGLLWMLKKKSFKKTLLFGLTFSVLFFLTQGLFDYLYYGNPLASTLEYFRYNANPENIKGYPTGSWYQYIGTIAAMLLGIPFIILLAGYIWSVKLSPSHKILFLSSFLFFLIHSYYANKQERFIIPFLPYFLLLGITGFADLYQQHKEKKWIRMLIRFSTYWFFILNTLLLFVLTFSFSKKSRVEVMSYLKDKNVSAIIMEGIDPPPKAPMFYLGKRVAAFELTLQKSTEALKRELASSENPAPEYIIMVGSKDLENRIARIKTVFPLLKREAVIAPGFIDNIAHKLNPEHNRNETWYIFHTE